MLTQYEVRSQLDAIANEVAQSPGVYYELYSRLFSERVHCWIRTMPPTEAAVIQYVAESDPDYLSDIAMVPPLHAQQNMLVNPAWDMDY